MVNIWKLFYSFETCGSGTSEYQSYILNDEIEVYYGTIQIPCHVEDRNAYVRDSFIRNMINYHGMTDMDIIYTNGSLYKGVSEPIPTLMIDVGMGLTPSQILAEQMAEQLRRETTPQIESIPELTPTPISQEKVVSKNVIVFVIIIILAILFMLSLIIT